MRTFLALLFSAVGLMAADVKISDLTLSTSPSTNTFLLISDMDAATKSQKYLLTNLVFQSEIANYMPLSETNTFATDLLSAAAAQVQANQTNVAAANPTATVATTAVNGTATTFMRSDASPAIPASFITANQTNVTLASLGGAPLANPSFTGTAQFENAEFSGTLGVEALAITGLLPGHTYLDANTNLANVDATAEAAMDKLEALTFGTAGALTNDGAGSLGWFDLSSLGGSATTNFSDAISAQAAAITNIYASSDNTAAHSIRIAPRGLSGGAGMGSVILESPESNTAGTARGNAAVDLQVGRNGAAKIASGNASFAAGTNCTASGTATVAMGTGAIAGPGTGAVAIGQNVTASGQGSFAVNDSTTASGVNASAFGVGALAGHYGEWALSSGSFSQAGDSQLSFLVASGVITLTTATETNLTIHTNPIDLPNNRTWAFDGIVVARTTGSATTETNACYTIKGCIARHADAASTTLLWSNVTPDYEQADVTAWDVALSADTTNGALIIRVTGAVLETIRWVAALRIVQIGG